MCVHVKVVSLAQSARGGKPMCLHVLKCKWVSECVFLCKTEANKVVEYARRRETKMWDKPTGEAGRGGILGTSNRSPHTHSETSSICRNSEIHEKQQGGRTVSYFSCVLHINTLSSSSSSSSSLILFSHIVKRIGILYIYSSCKDSKP